MAITSDDRTHLAAKFRELFERELRQANEEDSDNYWMLDKDITEELWRKFTEAVDVRVMLITKGVE